MAVALNDVVAAAGRLAGAVLRTPLIAAPGLSASLGLDLRLKLENLQHTSSFKVRGALAKLSRLEAGQREAGVIAMSAGNHAQGVAFHARRLAIPATIVMPAHTPFSKVERTRQHGAQVELVGDSLEDAADHAARLAAERGLTMIHPYDDPDIIAGQGTIALEMLADAPDIETLVVPIGGGGLISGIAVAAKALKPSIRLLGVQAEAYPSMYCAIRGEPAPPAQETLAEGIAVKTPGRLTRAIVERLVDDILLVGEAEIERAVQLLLEGQRIVAEGAGAAGVAALLAHPGRFTGGRVATVVCGGNIDSRVLASVLLRGLVRDARMVRIRVESSDAPGSLARITGAIGDSGGNIVEIYHQRLFHDVPVKLAEIDIVVETRNAHHVREILERLGAAGHRARLISSTDLAGEAL